MRLTAPKHSPFFEMTSIQSMPSLRPFSHMPPSEIGSSSRSKSVLYDRTSVPFGACSVIARSPSQLVC